MPPRLQPQPEGQLDLCPGSPAPALAKKRLLISVRSLVKENKRLRSQLVVSPIRMDTGILIKGSISSRQANVKGVMNGLADKKVRCLHMLVQRAFECRHLIGSAWPHACD